MKVSKTPIEGVLLLEPKVFHDERGFFYESFQQRAFSKQTGVQEPFVQDNHSHSAQGVLRGLHYQIKQAQGKIVRVLQGRIFDVVVDLRPYSPTFGKWESFELSGENRLQLWIPPGLAHGFLTLSATADLLYKTTDYYAPTYERTLLWNDATLNISWPLNDSQEIKLSDKDQKGFSLAEARQEIEDLSARHEEA